jgi:2,4-dienoyl-CoA reductase-like NADH-dependent reductase (Old Yellow Enzyme family)
MNASAHAPLFTPWQLNGLDLSNRLAVAPMTRISATPEGMPTETMARYYERFARGGFALVITEGIYTDQAYSQGYANQPGLSDLEQAKGWRPVVDAVHAAGGKIVAQLMHAGALSQANRFRTGTAGPSAVRPKGLQMAFYRGDGPYRLPRAMSETDIAEAIQGFARAAAFAIEVAGFDGVEIHGANGYLLDQFLTDYANLRSDAWGGAIAQRVRLSVEVARAVRQAVGNAIPAGIRISQGKVNDFTHKWAEAEAGAEAVFGALADTGLDYVHVTEFEAWRPAFSDDGPSLVSLARKHAPELTIIANGSLHDPVRAEQVLRDGADLIALGRGALANPAWPRLVMDGRALQSFDRALLSPLGNIKPSELTKGNHLPEPLQDKVR